MLVEAPDILRDRLLHPGSSAAVRVVAVGGGNGRHTPVTAAGYTVSLAAAVMTVIH